MPNLFVEKIASKEGGFSKQVCHRVLFFCFPNIDPMGMTTRLAVVSRFQPPNWKICDSQIGSFLQISGLKNSKKKYLKLPPRGTIL